jgi:short-subunit dehydrogenase
VIYGIRAFLPHLALGGRGHIVNTASMAGLVPALNPIYDATKHAVVAITENLYHDMQAVGFGVGVSVLCPGWVNTKIFDAERNWPTEQGERPPMAPTSVVIMPHLKRATNEGLTPAAVAELVTNGIEEERFWLLTHPNWMPMALNRWESIAEGVNPELPEALPDFPPRSQLIEEILAKMAEQQ